MAPFSYFRSQHRRAGSTPSSDSPRSPLWKGSHSPFAAGSAVAGDDSAQSPNSLRPSAIPSPAVESPVSPAPPVLPPIPRVASKHEQLQRSHSVSKSDAGPRRGSVNTEPPAMRHNPEPQATAINTQPPPAASPILPPIPRIMTRRLPGQEPLKIKTTDTRAPGTGYRRRQPLQLQPDPSLSSQARDADNSSTGSAFTGQPAAQDFAARPATPPITQSANELVPPASTISKRPSSPSSSLSSFQRSTALQIDTSPGSSKANAPRMAKPKKNLLNPVSLLRRRRTAQHVETISDAPALGVPMDYDPRIKGKGVHDFNAPRPRRHHSINAIESAGAPVVSDASPVDVYRRQSLLAPPTIADKPAAPEHDHVTVFHENFDDNADEDSSASAVNRESLANSSFLARMSRRLDFESTEFAHSSPETPSESQTQAQAQTQASSAAGERTSKSTVGAPSVRMSSDQSTARSSISNDTRATSPPGSPPLKQQRGSLTLEPPFQPEGLPKHFSSSASRNSRFSFQLNSEATLEQEKALEEKGKERAARAQLHDSDDDDGFGDSSDDVTDFGDFDDGPYEEEIPMVNVVDDNEADDWADNKAGVSRVQSDFVPDAQVTQDEIYNDYEANQIEIHQQIQNPERQETQESEDSMYFDDGLIDDPPGDATHDFDESLFDSPIKTRDNDVQFQYEYPGSDQSWQTRGAMLRIGNGLGIACADTNHKPVFPRDVAQGTGADGLHSSQSYQSNSAGLGKLDAYHDALASAATTAEANGRFQRRPSVDISVSDVGSDGGSKMSHVSGFEVGPVDWTEDNFDDTDLDGLEDDSMVAAANAEILASEDSEFYGQEFGFYGASSNGDVEMFNGGFFAAAPDDIKTGMNAGREPNLTPITERSEFSTRNSFISLPPYGTNPSAPNSAISRNDMPLPSPVLGLKELAASMNMDEDDMTLSQLIKLRKETFRSSGSSMGGSPSSSLPNGSSFMMQNAFTVQTVQEEDQEPLSSDWFPQDDNFGDEEDDEDTFPADERLASHQLSAGPNTLPLRTPPSSGSAQETPKPLSAFKTQSFLFAPTSGNAMMASPPLSPPNTAIPITSHPAVSPGRAWSPPVPSAAFSSLPATRSAPTSPAPMPMPSPSLIHKFASRPPASSASYAERYQRRSLASCDSVAYVMEDSKWYLERRRRLSGGELIVVGRELVEGGRI